jgi:hypothetical protein
VKYSEGFVQEKPYPANKTHKTHKKQKCRTKLETVKKIVEMIG